MRLLTRADLRRFASELRRRKVVRVAVAYAVGGWVTIQVSATVLPYLGLPPEAVTVIIVLVAAGFPLALVLSWAYDLKPDQQGWFSASPTEAGGPTLERELTAPLPTRYRVPAPAHTLVGRAKEVSELSKAARSQRLITLTGPGGIGKTRLALEVATALQEELEHGACFVPLDSVEAVERVIPALAVRLRLPLGSDDPRKRIIDYLREKELLLLLDNFEHLAAASTFLLELLEAAPEVRIMVTSRERLRLSAETLFPLNPLGLEGEGEELSHAEELFVVAARRQIPSYAPFGEARDALRRICQHLDGIPLAIELAAAWVGSLSETEIEREIERSQDFLQAGLRDIPERHRSLRAAFESSWKLLEPAEQRTFARLAVFRGGFDRAGAERVTGATPALLSALQGKSLLKNLSEGRSEALEVLRSYAEEKLEMDPAEASATRLRHCAYFAELLATAGAPPAATPGTAPTRLEEELDNLRGAWSTAVGEGRSDLLRGMTDPLFEFYRLRGWAREGEEVFAEALEALPGEPEFEPSLKGPLLIRRGFFRYQLGRGEEARADLEAGRQAVEGAGSARECALALEGLGMLAQRSGDYDVAQDHFTAILAAAEEASDAKLRGHALGCLGVMAWTRGDNRRARRLFGEAIPLLRSTDAGGPTTAALRNLGIVEAAEGKVGEAEALFREALEMERRTGNQRGAAFALQHLAVLAHDGGNHALAQRHLADAIELARESGNRLVLAYCSNEAGVLALREGDHPRARELFTRALGLAVEIGARPLALEVLIGFSRIIAEVDDDPLRAVEILTAVQRHASADQGVKESAGTLLEELRPALDPERLGAATARGEAADAMEWVEKLRERVRDRSYATTIP